MSMRGEKMRGEKMRVKFNATYHPQPKGPRHLRDAIVRWLSP